MISLMWYIKLKAKISKQGKQTKTHWHRQQCSGYGRKGGRGVVKGKGDQIYGDILEELCSLQPSEWVFHLVASCFILSAEGLLSTLNYWVMGIYWLTDNSPISWWQSKLVHVQPHKPQMKPLAGKALTVGNLNWLALCCLRGEGGGLDIKLQNFRSLVIPYISVCFSPLLP